MLLGLDAGELGIAIILCGRKALGIKEVWNKRLEELTMCKFDDIKRAYKLLEK